MCEQLFLFDVKVATKVAKQFISEAAEGRNL